MRAGKGTRTPTFNDRRMGVANLEHSTARGVIPLVGAMYLGHLLLVVHGCFSGMRAYRRPWPPAGRSIAITLG